MLDRVLEPAGKAFVAAQYGKALMNGDYAERAQTYSASTEEVLVHAVMAALPTGTHARRGYSKIIRNYFGGKIGVHAIRTDLQCSMADVPVHRKRVYDTLDSIWTRAAALLEIEMLQHGLLN